MNRIYFIILLIAMVMSGCCEAEEMWLIRNSGSFSIQVVNTYIANGEVVVDECQIGPFQGIFVTPGESTDVSSYLSRDWAFKERPGLTLYFIPCFEGLDKVTINERLKYAVANIPMNKQWMEANDWTINFPEDCTVNPELGEIYDLDEFVELYGPLNAQGWDEVWQRWQQSKEYGDNPQN